MRDTLQISTAPLLTSPSVVCGGPPTVPVETGVEDCLRSRVQNKLCQVAARTLYVIIGCAAVAWGICVLPGFLRQSAVERIAKHVIAGDPFRPVVLATFMPLVEGAERAEPCRPAALSSAAMIRTRLAEQAIVNGEDIDAKLMSLNDSIRRALACSPADSFLWAVLYWVESIQNGFRPANLEYLRLSYQLGPNEGWIAMKRNGFALSIFQKLPPAMATMVIAEFANLLNSGFYVPVIAIFEGPGWSQRALLLPNLKDVSEYRRQMFADALYKDGYDVTVPGIAPRDPRPWD